MKRYRILDFMVDTTRNTFNVPGHEDWAAKRKQQMESSIASRYGEWGLERKFKRYMDLQKPSLTVVGEFSYLLEDVSNAYIAGNLYSALTGACCLGERIFNQIIFGIADYHKSSSHYKKVHGRGSFNDW